MRCARCGRRNSAASWYCAHCGQALPDTNVATGGGHRRLRPLALGALVLALAVAVGGGLALTRGGGSPPAGPVLRPSPTTAAPVVAGAPTAAPIQGSSTAPAPATPRIVTPAAPAGTSEDVGEGATAAASPMPLGGPVWRIPYLSRPPQLDGRLDEWPALPLPIQAIVFGQEYWDGPADLSAEAVAGWDNEHLFLGVRVVDDVFSQPAQGTRLYLGDSLELQLDADRQGDADSGEYNGDDFQIGLSPGDFGARRPEAYVWRPGNVTGVEVAVAAQRLDDGYVLEAAIPWRALGAAPNRTPSLGIALNVSDNDLPAPAQLTMASSTPNRSWGDPRTFGTLVLVPPGERPVAPASQQGPPP